MRIGSRVVRELAGAEREPAPAAGAARLDGGAPLARCLRQAPSDLTRRDLEAQMAIGAGAPPLPTSKQMIDAVFKRRDFVLKYVGQLVHAHGEDEVYYFE